MSKIEWINQARELIDNGFIDEALDVVYDKLDMLLNQHRWTDCIEILHIINPVTDNVHLLLAVLTLTYPAKQYLPEREKFFLKVESYLHSRGEYEQGLLDGLN